MRCQNCQKRMRCHTNFERRSWARSESPNETCFGHQGVRQASLQRLEMTFTLVWMSLSRFVDATGHTASAQVD